MKKNILVFAAFLLCGGLISTSCNKSDDTTVPVITVGSKSVFHMKGVPFSPSVTANDDTDGNITSKIATTGTVDYTTAGTYTLTFNVEDEAGNKAVAETMTVIIVDVAGQYDVIETANGAQTAAYVETISISSLQNNKILFSRFGNYDNGSVYGTFADAILTIPSQDVACGTPSATRTFSGNGTITKASPVTITYTYTELTNGTALTYNTTYTKK